MNNLKFFLYFLTITLLFVFWGLFARNNRKVKPAFYYWKTTDYGFNNLEADLKAIHSKKVYIRMFDVSFNDAEGVIPLAPLEYDLSNLCENAPNDTPMDYFKKAGNYLTCWQKIVL